LHRYWSARISGYQQQGYYSAVGRKIPLAELTDYLRLVPATE
jgi:hypothetical protein